ncbi:MAG TPA: MerR family transcriptional regulator [Burkholderiales bacterium]|nr:MerR family transcriptional regulator [Burkholderiales bacterium]
MTLNISAVERDTGLSKDTLRVWERRYGFPEPARDANGERVYPLSQVRKLQLIKRLMDRGHRPGKIVSLGLEELTGLSATAPRRAPGEQIEILARLIATHQLPELRRQLAQALMKQGLQRFVIDTIAPLNRAVGEAWMRGDIGVFEEHLYTEQIQGVLRNALAALQPQGRGPRVLLTTFPHEPHGLGLLMVEALLAVEGACCVPLGTEMPLAEIARAVRANRIDVLALSFSAAFNEKQGAAGLAELRAMLPGAVAIWAGGECVARMRKPVEGVELVGELATVVEMVKQWRARHAGA